MVYDSIANGSIPTAASNSKDFGKKKRVNRSAKLKQSKLDVRREQWLSQVKNKGLGTGAKEEAKMRVPDVHAVKERERERERDMVKLEISVGENEGGYSDTDDELQKNCETESDVRETVPEPEPVLTTRAGQEGMHMHHGVGFAPSACPICCEDLDMTDSSFLPCPCGYRLCLFCHKRILEDNGRCPGCRQKYEQPDQGTAPAKLARCYSMNPKLQK
ncbi:Zinc finger, RING/FYVE/PHD-type [Artemisia annua]|uniref:Zinc finger, RING/FYVE/PHD-type n=1 Tax=Artemisia annua TaxID=35608 RepID=A0A2U1NTA3_ARTAN|nr:Zinc finger, RING/FYVE/PHD-type [Artemisia annua]